MGIACCLGGHDMTGSERWCVIFARCQEVQRWDIEWMKPSGLNSTTGLSLQNVNCCSQSIDCLSNCSPAIPKTRSSKLVPSGRVSALTKLLAGVLETMWLRSSALARRISVFCLWERTAPEMGKFCVCNLKRGIRVELLIQDKHSSDVRCSSAPKPVQLAAKLLVSNESTKGVASKKPEW